LPGSTFFNFLKPRTLQAFAATREPGALDAGADRMRSRFVQVVLLEVVLAGCAPAVTPIDLPGATELLLFGSSKDDLWALRDATQLLHREGGAWVEVATPDRVRGSNGYLYGIEEPCSAGPNRVYVGTRFDIFEVATDGTQTRLENRHPEPGWQVGGLRTKGSTLIAQWWKAPTNIAPYWPGTYVLDRFDGKRWETLADAPGIVLGFEPADAETVWAAVQVQPIEAQQVHLFRLRAGVWQDFGAFSGPTWLFVDGWVTAEDGWLVQQLGVGGYAGISDTYSEDRWRTLPTMLQHAHDGQLETVTVPFPDAALGEHRCGPSTLGVWERGGRIGLGYTNRRCSEETPRREVFFQQLSASGEGATEPWAQLDDWASPEADVRRFRLGDGTAVFANAFHAPSRAWVMP
jgi:hypothetical protein